MKQRREPPLLRMYRRTYGFTLREIAALLNLKSSAHISRLEQGKRRPTLETALTSSALFGVPLAELFPQLTSDVEARFRVRLTSFRKGCEKRSTPTAMRKLALVDRVLDGSSGPIPTIDA